MTTGTRQLRASTFVVFAVMSTVFMLVYLDRWGMPPALFVLGIIATSSLVLSVEVLAMLAVRRRQHVQLTRRQWVQGYAIASLAGSVTMLVTLAVIGLAQDRAPFVVGLIFATRLVNTLIVAYAIDEMASYRNSATIARRNLIPRLQIVRAMNEQLEQAETTADIRDLETIRSTTWIPLQQLRQQIDRNDDSRAASDIETFIDRVLRPLSHELHPITPDIGLLRAVEALGYRVEAPAVISEMDKSNSLLDDDVRLEAFRWLTRTTAFGHQQPRVVIALEQRALSIQVVGARCSSLDPLQRAAGLTVDASETLHVPLRGQLTEQLTIQATAVHSRRVGTRFLPRAWQWRGQGHNPSLPLVAALAFAAVPGGTYVANAAVTTATAAAAATWLIVPLTLAWILRKVVVQGRGWKPLAWFLFTWIGLGVFTGVASGATYLFFDSSAGMVIVAQEVARGLVRLTLIGGLVALTAEFADNAQRALANIDTALHKALQQRADILTRARNRSQLIAEVLHRRIQGRLSAIAVLFRLHQRDRAIEELDLITNTVLPDLMTSLLRQPESSRLSSIEAPPGLAVHLFGHEHCADIDSRVEAVACRVIEEAATNAYRHGNATAMEVRVSATDDFLTVVCRDNGQGLQTNHRPGLGSRLFDDATGETGHWNMSSSHAGTTIEFAIPLRCDSVEPTDDASLSRSPALNR